MNTLVVLVLLGAVPMPDATARALDVANELRSEPAFRSAELGACAQRYAEWLADAGYQGGGGHSMDGRNHQQRAEAAGFRGQVAEILGYGPSTADFMIKWWAARDSGHYFVLLGQQYQVCGFGCAMNSQGRLVWVGLFGVEDRAAKEDLYVAAGSRYRDPQRNLPSWELEMIEAGKSTKDIEAEWDRRYTAQPHGSHELKQPLQAPQQAPTKHQQAPLAAQAPAAACGSCGASYGYRGAYRGGLPRGRGVPILRRFRR